jgi:hypothetical protein
LLDKNDALGLMNAVGQESLAKASMAMMSGAGRVDLNVFRPYPATYVGTARTNSQTDCTSNPGGIRNPSVTHTLVVKYRQTSFARRTTLMTDKIDNDTGKEIPDDRGDFERKVEGPLRTTISGKSNLFSSPESGSIVLPVICRGLPNTVKRILKIRRAVPLHFQREFG